MATRFHLHASGSAAVSPSFDGSWEQTGQATRLPMDVATQKAATTTLTNSSAITVPITTTQDILCYQFVSNQIFLPILLDTSVLFSMVVRGLENATTNNVFIAYVLTAVRAIDGLVLATLSSNQTGGGTEFTAAAQTRIFAQTAISSTKLSEPWRLCFELGGHATGPTAAGSYTLRAGCNAASDFALTSGLTTDLNPWMELSYNLCTTGQNNYQAHRVGAGMSSNERIR